jgi:methylated-DNA-[protein]-cysteine S-methyltransferase
VASSVGLRSLTLNACEWDASWTRTDMPELTVQLGEYFAGKRSTFNLPLDPQGSAFDLEVWQALANIPYGQTTTYGELAAQVGRPKGAQAVGGANGRNPLAIIIPCHRVIGKRGALTGYAGGLDRKRALLTLEGSFNEPLSLFG